jgi:hypothetical protein
MKKKSDHFEGVMDKEGVCVKSWSIKDENNLLREGKIIVKVSKDDKTSSELTETFQINWLSKNIDAQKIDPATTQS